MKTNKAHQLAEELGFKVGWETDGHRTYVKEVAGEDLYISIPKGNRNIRVYCLGRGVHCEFWMTRKLFLSEATTWVQRLKEHVEFDWKLRMQSKFSTANVRTRRVLP